MVLYSASHINQLFMLVELKLNLWIRNADININQLVSSKFITAGYVTSRRPALLASTCYRLQNIYIFLPYHAKKE